MDDLVEGIPKSVQLDKDSSALVIKHSDGLISAVGNKCTHYGAPLIKGSYSPCEQKLRCPWHGACFDAITGDIEDFPGLDSLPKYDVSVDTVGNVKITANKALIKANRRQKSMVKQDGNAKTVLIVGAGGAAQTCAENLRSRPHQPWTGKIVMVTQEDAGPYDRPKLSKALFATSAQLALRPDDFYKEAGIDLITQTEVTGVDLEAKIVKIGDDSLKWDYLVLATGGRPRSLDIPGNGLDNVFLLRSPSDANKIANGAIEKDVVIVGASFIGTEVASFLHDKAKSVTVIASREAPFAKSLGPQVGKYIQKLHEAKGVQFAIGSRPKRFIGGDDGKIREVELENGTVLKADLVVLGVGVMPSTQFLQGSGIEVDKGGHVVVDNNMESVSSKGIFAAGDIASFPLKWSNKNVAIGHWQIALCHGRVAGLNVGSDTKTEVDTVPFFWTVQYGKSIRYAGYAPEYDDIVVDGNTEEGNFAAYYCQGDVAVAVATLNKDPVAAEFANHIKAGNTLSKQDVLTKWY